MIDINIDLNSNLYINNHWISINKNNDLEAIFIKPMIGDNKNNIKIVEQLDKKINRKLQAKLIDDEISKFIDIDNDGEIFDDDDSVQMITNYIYNPETKFINYHNDDYDENNEDSFNNLEPYFDINGIPKFSLNTLELSLYEFYYFGSDLNDLKYYTHIINDNPIYRISYYESLNQIKLNIIGESIKTFEIKTNKENNTLEFIKINVNHT